MDELIPARRCGSCRFAALEYIEEPCHTCDGYMTDYSMWQPVRQGDAKYNRAARMVSAYITGYFRGLTGNDFQLDDDAMSAVESIIKEVIEGDW